MQTTINIFAIIYFTIVVPWVAYSLITAPHIDDEELTLSNDEIEQIGVNDFEEVKP